MLIAFALAAALLYSYLFFIVPRQPDPGGRFAKDNILQSLNGDTRVYYSDGESILGSFFDTNHRLYVPYDSIPQTLIYAIVASEDSKFWEHKGFDIGGFMRAMLKNIAHRSFKQGGSTISQQTVKNIFGREQKSIKAKWTELTDALMLEERFTKQDILEFYLNQFQVYGSGRGAAIAAIYFFNKPLKELGLEECAFIAGAVKGPYNYDPRAQKTEEKKKWTLEKGQARVKYVLRRMFENGYISEKEYAATKTLVYNNPEADTAKTFSLNYGEFRFNTSSVLEKVDRELNEDFYSEIFNRANVENWRHAQIKIITTIDAKLQSQAEKAVKENLQNLQKKIGADTINPVQGALVAVKNGMIIASQSGQNNIGYDRVFIAERQLGSSWKPLLYALALKFGWKPLDLLENEYNLFTYGPTVYFPRPDHTDRSPQVSIAWAAVRSENIASIWLLEHLLDKLLPENIKTLAAKYQIDTNFTAKAKNEIALAKAKAELKPSRALQALKYYYNQSEWEKQKKTPEKAMLLRHNYEYYASALANKSMDFEDENAELFPGFTVLDFKQLQNLLEQKKTETLQPNDIYLWPELRQKIAMSEFANFAKSIGINRNLQEVMSLPLGVNEATMAEMVLAYQSILGGKRYKCKDGNELCIIKEIKDRDGKSIFKNEIEAGITVLPDSVVLPMQAMLRAVFKYGTAAGSYSKIATTYDGVKYPFPAMGKTGTTNENRTAAFCGAMPLDTLLTICSYVGFDDNNKLKGKTSALAGASGALPQWAGFASAALAADKSGRILGEGIDYISAIWHGEVILPNMPETIEVDKKGGKPLKDEPSETNAATFPNF